MMKCPKCGSSYPDDIKFCLVDGTVLVEDLPPTIQMHSDAFMPQAVSSKPPGINPLFAILPTALLALILGGAIVYWLKTEKTPDSQNISPLKQTEAVANRPVNNQKSPLNSPKIEQNSIGTNSIQRYRVIGTPDSFLSLRDKADPKSIEITRIPIGTIIEVDTNKGTEIYKGKTWLFVNYQGKSGWVNSYYLEKQ